MQKVYFLSLLLFLFLFSSARKPIESDSDKSSSVELRKDFIGILTYIEYTPFDTSFFKVYVSKDKIRIDSFDDKNANGDAKKIMIYNLKNQNIIALKPSSLQYKNFGAHSNSDMNIEDCEIILNKNNYKYLNNYKCVQYRVKNKSENTDITYWIPEEDFPFYSKMISMKRSMQRVHKYFFMLPNHTVAFPMQTTERTMLREEKSSYKLLELKESYIADEIFEIPEDYILNE